MTTGTEELTGYRARILHPLSSTEVVDISDGLMIFDSTGKLRYLGEYKDGLCSKLIDNRGKLIIPGLVDVHSHIPQLDQRGKHGATLLSWLDKYIFPAERAFSDPKVVCDVATRFFKKLILNGTTFAGLYSTVHKDATDICFEIAARSGVRCFIGKVMMDVNSPDGLIETTKSSLDDSYDLCSKWNNHSSGRLRYAFTPRFIPTCSLELIRESAKMAREAGAYFQTHIAESLAENQRVLELHPQYETTVDLYEDLEALFENTIFAHAIHLTDEEFGKLARNKVKIAHCPTSNFFLKSGCMDGDRVEKFGIDYGLGTDVGAGTSMSVFAEMRHADFARKNSSVAPMKAFYLATLGGAKCVGQENVLGNFELGKFADFLVLDITKIDLRYRLSQLDTDEVLSLLMYRGDGRAVESTHVAGKKLDVDSFDGD